MTAKRKKSYSSEVTTIAEAAKRLNIGINQAYTAAALGQLPAIRIGRRYLVPVAALDRLLAGEANGLRQQSA
jgi:excisionase family DNA binding protein